MRGSGEVADDAEGEDGECLKWSVLRQGDFEERWAESGLPEEL